MAYLSAEFAVPPDRTESVLVALTGLGMLGSEEVSRDNGVRFRAYFAGSADRRAVAAALDAAGVGGPVSLVTVEERDWNAAWRASIQPVELAPGTWVSPSWRPPPLAPGQQWIRIEPRMAFGTGHHESTRLAARGIRAAAGLLGSCRSLLDVGAGSGVLCFYGALLGFGPCLGVEIDPCCRESLSANLRDNPVPEGVRLVVGDVACVRPRVRFGVIAMNMIYPEAAPLLSGLTQRLEKQGGAGLWSGLLTEGRQEACEAAKRARLTLAQEFAENEWWAGLFSLSGGDA